ncbi:carbon-nitrogen hydrolase family protein [Gordonia sputi]
MPADRLRIALWQCHSVADDVEGNLDRLEQAASEAAEADADLLITPEMYLTGYNISPSTARRLADPVDGDAVGNIARRTAIAILYGGAELDDSSVYNTVRLVDANGISLASHRKTHLFGDIDRDAVAVGVSPPPVIDVEGWSLGLLICYEVEFPELVRNLAVRGAEVICVPTANMPEYDAVQTVLLPARALENTVYVAYANYCGVEGDLAYGGLSEGIGPDGRVLARAEREPGLLIVDVERKALDDARERFTYLADRRTDLLS